MPHHASKPPSDHRMMAAKPRLSVEFALLALLSLLWGSSYLLVKVSLETIPPLTLIAIRVTVAAACLIAVAASLGYSLPRDRRSWCLLLVQVLFNSIGAWTVLAWGQQYVDSGLAGVLNSTSPIFVFFITLAATRHEAVSARKFFGAMLGVFGVALIVGVDALEGLGQQVFAQLAVLFGAVLYAIAAIYGRRFAHLHPAVTAAGTMLWATVVLVPLSFVVDRPWTLSPSPRALLSALALAVFCTAGALLIYFRLVRTLGSMGVASQSYLRAAVSVLLGIAVLGEQLTPTIALGIGAALAGVAAINLPTRRGPG
jgi:drug/metabolite transporter (DMT)-like permease